MARMALQRVLEGIGSTVKAVVISIRPEWIRAILDGTKTTEYRSGFPEDFEGTVFVYESGPQGRHKVLAVFRTAKTAKCHPSMFTDEMAAKRIVEAARIAGMPDAEFDELLTMDFAERPVTLLPILAAKRLPEPLGFEEFNRMYKAFPPLTRAPITWQRVEVETPEGFQNENGGENAAKE